MKDLVIIGAGGFGREVKELVDEINQDKPTWNFIGFVDDNADVTVPEVDTVLGRIDYLLHIPQKPYVVISIANAAVRKKYAELFASEGFEFATLIHPDVTIRGNRVKIGEGTIICSKTNISINVQIGKHCIINTSCGFGHDTTVGDYCGFMPRTVLTGEVVVGDSCYFGVRSTVINRINITDHCTVGACACVVKDLTESGTYVGIPAKRIK